MSRPNLRLGASRYDVEMIRDFLDHLAWEVRVVQHESISHGDRLNPELQGQLKKYMDKYNGVLMEISRLDTEGLPAAPLGRAVDNYRAARAAWAEEQLRHLEALRGLFEEALQCAATGIDPARELPERWFKARDFLSADMGGNPDSPYNRKPTEQ
jgi:hypothetical protein